MNGVLYFNGHGEEGAELWKYVSETVISVVVPENFDGVSVYPNPSTGSFTVEIADSRALTSVEVLDYFGRRIPSTVSVDDDGRILLTVNRDAAGLYLLNLQMNGRI